MILWICSEDGWIGRLRDWISVERRGGVQWKEVLLLLVCVCVCADRPLPLSGLLVICLCTDHNGDDRWKSMLRDYYNNNTKPLRTQRCQCYDTILQNFMRHNRALTVRLPSQLVSSKSRCIWLKLRTKSQEKIANQTVEMHHPQAIYQWA